MEGSPIEVVCANGDLYRVHDSTQAQRTDYSTTVFQMSSHFASATHALRKVKISTSETRTASSTSAKTSLLNRFDPSHRQMYKFLRFHNAFTESSVRGFTSQCLYTRCTHTTCFARTLQRLSHSCVTRTVEVTMLDRPRQLPHCSHTADCQTPKAA